MQIAEVQCYFVVKTAWLYCTFSRFAMRIILTTEQWIDVQSHSRSSTFNCNRKPMYDFLLVINCHLSSISHRFGDIVSWSRKPPQPSLSPPPRSRIKFLRISPSNLPLPIKTLRYFYVKTAWSSVALSVVIIHLSHWRQTDDLLTTAEHCNTNCNVRLKNRINSESKSAIQRTAKNRSQLSIATYWSNVVVLYMLLYNRKDCDIDCV